MNWITIAFLTLFVVVCVTGFCFRMKNGKKTMKKNIENNFRYVTIKDIEDMAEEMRAKGAGDDAIMVLVKPDWWEDPE